MEDVSDATVISRHERCEALEKGKYLQKRKSSRRHHSRSGTNSNPPLTPSETPPHTPATIVTIFPFIIYLKPSNTCIYCIFFQG